MPPKKTTKKVSPRKNQSPRKICKVAQASVDLFADTEEEDIPDAQPFFEEEVHSQDLPSQQEMQDDDDDATQLTQLPPADPSPITQTTTHPQRSSDVEVEGVSDDQAASRLYGAQKKKKLTRVTLNQEDEAKVVEWLRANPMLYDKKDKNYKDSDKKWRMHEVMGRSLTPPITGKNFSIIVFSIPVQLL